MTSTTPSSAQRESRLLNAFLQWADTLVDDYDIPDILHQLTEHCVDLLDAAAAGLLLADQRGSLQLLASSTEHTRLLELFQLQTNEGPCLDCFRTGEPVAVADLTKATTRWPHFAPRAQEEGFAAVHAVPLQLRGETIGTLNLFNHQPGSLTRQDARVARALADMATIGVLQERAIRRGEVLTEQLQTALNSRVVIEQGKGLLAHAGHLDMDQAFHALRAYARGHNSRFTEVAHQLVTGKLHPDDVLTTQNSSVTRAPT
ncbi:GAF and ANTAR domain-containing protein [Qaidamihabitans albus]|uniref:GAF and ANTAR domain-containing protein n=1 Tax=Qaidamihabitans albus TaxID=2795733 RepID=UPI0018F1B4D1|nr:GAF and ANTAR domain-containing protein [Qaidamihabitans albus]